MSATIVVDGGASGARARLHGASRAVTVALDEPLSLTTVDADDVLERLGRLMAALPDSEPVTAITAGLAGGATRDRTEPVAEVLRQRHPGADVNVVRDVDLVLAHLHRPGAALVVGTGAVVLAPAPDGEVLVDGRGFGVGDRGGGAWIGLEALRATLRACDLDGEAPRLLRALCDELGLPTDRGVATALAEGGALGARRVAALAPVVLALADEGDRDASQVVDRAVAEVVLSVRAALRRARCPSGAEVVAAGGVTSAPVFSDRLTRALADGGAVAELRLVDPLDAALLPRASG